MADIEVLADITVDRVTGQDQCLFGSLANNGMGMARPPEPVCDFQCEAAQETAALDYRAADCCVWIEIVKSADCLELK